MFPDLSYILHAIFGTEPDGATSIVKTFGLMLVVSFLVSAYFLSLELKRKEQQGLIKATKSKITVGQAPTTGEIIINALVGFILGFKVPYIIEHFEAFKSDAAGMLFSTDGNILIGLLVMILFAGYRYWDKNRKKLPKPKVQTIRIRPHQRVNDITVVAAFSGIVGAKLFALIESKEAFSAFLSDPIGQLLSGSGMAIYGGLIVAFVVVYNYVKKRGIPPIHMMDAVAPALIMGYAVGRIGCQLSGDGDWGIVNTLAKPSALAFLPDWLWAYDYPHNVLNRGELIEGCTWKYCSRLSEAVFPTPIYETVMSLIIFAALWFNRKRIVIPGMMFFLYMVLNGIERFWIEKIRVNDKIDVFGMLLTQAEIISILTFVAGIVGCYVVWHRHRTKNPNADIS